MTGIEARIAEEIGFHEPWQRPDRSWECACGRRFGAKPHFDVHVAAAVVAELGLTEENGVHMTWGEGYVKHRWVTGWEKAE